MDPALLRERELFKKRALATPTVEKKKRDTESSAKDEIKKKPKLSTPSFNTNSNSAILNYKTVSGNSQFKFGILAKIVKYMKTRHQEGDDHPLTLDEILDETNQLFVTNNIKTWLETEALPNNPKIELTPEKKFIFKPPLKIKDKKSLLRLLKQYDLKGQGGILLEEVQESLPHCEKVLKHLQHEIVYITRPVDKKKVVFYNDKTANLNIDEDFQKLWRSVTVENMDDDKIEEYLEKQGIKSMQDHGIKKKVMPIKRKKPVNRNRQNRRPRENEHLAHVLENYDNMM
ncbi:transcription initiation factor IIE subunit beta [Planococcus citri]|uniref:transcription initiation factor IIE subunit beta n=1 Tax=Planococcus citri TaxID=170843 RepID=UPI0031F7F58C